MKTTETFGMKPRLRVTLPALAALLAALSPHTGHAATRSCAAIAVEPDVGFRERFPDLLERIRGELAARPELDTCARVAAPAGGTSRSSACLSPCQTAERRGAP